MKNERDSYGYRESLSHERKFKSCSNVCEESQGADIRHSSKQSSGSKPQLNETKPDLRPNSIHQNETGVPLAACQVVYIGATSPEAGTSGLQAVQKPLLQLYKHESDGSCAKNISNSCSNCSSSFVSSIIKEGAKATLAVYSFGVKFIYLPENDSPSVNIWFPISNLFVCAAVRCVRSSNDSKRFVPLDLQEADESNEAPLFAAIFRQSRARHITECFCFVCSSKQDAMDLVLGCTTAFESFVRNCPAKSSKMANENVDSSIPLKMMPPNCDDDEYEDSEKIAEEAEWQPILVRRLWLPAPAPQIFYNSMAKGNFAKNKSIKSKHNPRPDFHNSFMGPKEAAMKWPSHGGIAVPSYSQRHSGSKGRQRHNLSASSSSLVGGSTYKDEKAVKRMLSSRSSSIDTGSQAGSFRDRHHSRQWASQPSLNLKGNFVTDDMFPENLTMKSRKKSKSGFVSKFKNLFTSTSSRRKALSAQHYAHQGMYPRLPNNRYMHASGHQRANGMIDYATIASDEADLLRVQTDCYGGSSNVAGGGTLTRHPLPNERAFMISIRNQQQQVVTTSKGSVAVKSSSLFKNSKTSRKVTDLADFNQRDARASISAGNKNAPLTMEAPQSFYRQQGRQTSIAAG